MQGLSKMIVVGLLSAFAFAIFGLLVLAEMATIAWRSLTQGPADEGRSGIGRAEDYNDE